ncbi:MAG: MupG family TIM beta-alpha barrel fold protein [Acidobacteriota bacterium]|nr:MupG family TIM beta-alpha barrel fold protein [Acidobacteriota bacterium]
MITLGVSVYPDIRPLDEIAHYLALAARHGYRRVFTSMFSVEGDAEDVLAYFRDLDDAAHEVGMEVSLDVNPACLARLGASPSDLGVFDGIGADILRMDGAYGEAENYEMLCNPYGIRIEYNASALDPATIESLVSRGVDRERILACHNFYPQRYTGFRWDRFQEVNGHLAPLGIRVGAFISSQAPGTHGVWDATCGLPTVECLRTYPADLQARIMAATGSVTDILFGNAYASEDELAAVAEAIAPARPVPVRPAARRVIAELETFVASSGRGSIAQRKVRVEPLYDISEVEREILFDFYPHVDVGDSSEWIWRTRIERQAYADEAIPARRHVGERFERGDVVIVNDAYKHYAGEVQVVLRPIVDDGTRNLVARIDAQEMDLFELVRDGDAVVFLPVVR